MRTIFSISFMTWGAKGFLLTSLNRYGTVGTGSGAGRGAGAVRVRYGYGTGTVWVRYTVSLPCPYRTLPVPYPYPSHLPYVPYPRKPYTSKRPIEHSS